MFEGLNKNSGQTPLGMLSLKYNILPNIKNETFWRQADKICSSQCLSHLAANRMLVSGGSCLKKYKSIKIWVIMNPTLNIKNGKSIRSETWELSNLNFFRQWIWALSNKSVAMVTTVSLLSPKHHSTTWLKQITKKKNSLFLNSEFSLCRELWGGGIKQQWQKYEQNILNK